MKRRIVPKYGYIPVIICLVWNILVYNISRIFTDRLSHYDFSTKFDDIIPFVPSFIVIYILSYLLWVIGFFVFIKESRSLCNEIFAAELIAKTVCFLFFIIVPTEMKRADVGQADGLFNWLINLTYFSDEPNNLFPSIHCMESWLCFRGAMRCKKTNSAYTFVWFILAVLICVSTVFVKQHVFVDIFAGILTAELGLFLSKRFGVGRIYDYIRLKWLMHKRLKRSKKLLIKGS